MPDKCSDNPDAPHGFNRTASHSIGRYVCDCEGWVPQGATPQPHPDTARVDWLLAMLDSDEKTLAMARCFALGMTGREAIDAAAKRHPL